MIILGVRNFRVFEILEHLPYRIMKRYAHSALIRLDMLCMKATDFFLQHATFIFKKMYISYYSLALKKGGGLCRISAVCHSISSFARSFLCHNFFHFRSIS